MKLFLDTANLEEIREINEWGVLGGITTNPSLIAKEKPNDWIAHAKEICTIVEGPVSLETTTTEVQDLIDQGRQLSSVSPNVVVKVVSTPQGLGACKALSSEGINVNVTLVFSSAQAVLAAEAGAFIVSPFLGRLDDISSDGINLLADICGIYHAQGYESRVLAASLRNPMHVVESARLGAQIASMPYKVFKQLIQHPLTEAGIKAFTEDWETLQKEQR